MRSRIVRAADDARDRRGRSQGGSDEAPPAGSEAAAQAARRRRTRVASGAYRRCAACAGVAPDAGAGRRHSVVCTRRWPAQAVRASRPSPSPLPPPMILLLCPRASRTPLAPRPRSHSRAWPRVVSASQQCVLGRVCPRVHSIKPSPRTVCVPCPWMRTCLRRPFRCRSNILLTSHSQHS